MLILNIDFKGLGTLYPDDVKNREKLHLTVITQTGITWCPQTWGRGGTCLKSGTRLWAALPSTPHQYCLGPAPGFTYAGRWGDIPPDGGWLPLPLGSCGGGTAWFRWVEVTGKECLASNIAQRWSSPSGKTFRCLKSFNRASLATDGTAVEG